VFPTSTPEAAEVAVQAAARALRNGNLVVIPTDTVYGVAAMAGSEAGLAKLFRIKGRDAGKPIPLLAAGVEDVLAAGACMSDLERRLADRFWPGALTMVLQAGDAGEGFRVPNSPVALSLIARAGGLLRVTSANLSGEPPALTADEAVTALGGGVAVVIDAGPMTHGEPSTVIRVRHGTVEILRQGALSAAALAEAAAPADVREA
jgi:tRNA threonylcarbamoyl adenosine modification protein (Sua5/YciO/YrdC/YwlC family)